MNRKKFLNSFSDFYINKYGILEQNIDSSENNPDKEKILNDFIKTLPLENKDDLYTKFNIKEDWDYMTDDPENDDWRFIVKCNLNELYDFIQVEDSHSRTIYRICDLENKGVYFKGCGTFLNSNQGSPYEDKNFKYIFPDIIYKSDYQSKWLFACKDYDQLKIWLNNEDNIKKLSERGMLLAKITIPENFLIEGKEQVIFNKDHVKKITYHNLNTLYLKNKNNKINL